MQLTCPALLCTPSNPSAADASRQLLQQSKQAKQTKPNVNAGNKQSQKKKEGAVNKGRHLLEVDDLLTDEARQLLSGPQTSEKPKKKDGAKTEKGQKKDDKVKGSSGRHLLSGE